MIDVVIMAALGVFLGFGRRELNRRAAQHWPSSRPGFQSVNARIAAAGTVCLAAVVSLAVIAVIGAPPWTVFVAAAPFIVIGDTRAAS